MTSRSTCMLVAFVATLWAGSAAADASSLPSFETVHRFELHEGWWPRSGPVIDAQGRVYGINSNGGDNKRYRADQTGCGTLYVETPGKAAEVHAFKGGVDGCFPVAELLLDHTGSVFGVTSDGGEFSHGTVYERRPDGKVRVLHAFNGLDGDYANAGLVRGADGALYGSTSYGGDHGRGTLYRIGVDGAFSTLYSFKSGDLNGEAPTSAMVLAPDGNLYGAAQFGRRGQGTVFRLVGGSTVELVHAFTGGDGDYPGALAVGRDGALYAGTIGGGRHGAGLVYRMTLDGAMTVLHTFDGRDGLSVFSALLEVEDGVFYGTTTRGGDSGTATAGTIFRVSSAGTFESIKSFLVGTDEGYESNGRLALGIDGNIYGTTLLGGNTRLRGNGCGTLFRLTPRP